MSKYILSGGELKILPKESIDMELYFILNGGTTNKILSVITTEFNKIKDNKYSLGLKPMINNNKINYRFINHTLEYDSINYPPALNAGGYSGIYELKNEYNKKDTTQYILRLFDRHPTYFTESNIYHMCDKKKIKEEYQLFNKYLLDIYHYGILKVHETGKPRITNIDYIITKLYNSSKYIKVSNFSPIQKYIFLKNNINMLLDFQKNNYFLADYKLSNIGWDNDLNIILIDYDSNSIIKIDDKVVNINPVIPGIRKLIFTHTYIPNYLTKNIEYYSSDVNYIENSKYDKYCVAGLVKIINSLELGIDLITEYKLEDSIYENILTYEDMLIKLELIKDKIK